VHQEAINLLAPESSEWCDVQGTRI